MKKTMITSAVLIAMLAITTGVQAASSWSAFMFNALNAEGAPISDGYYRMVVDVNGDGLISSGVDISTTWNWDASDYVMDAGQILNGECYPFASLPSRPTGVDSTDNIYLLWFDKPAGAMVPGADTHYGVELLGVVDSEPGDYTFFPVGGVASQSTPSAVPEPASLSAVALGLMFLIGRRRRAA